MKALVASLVTALVLVGTAWSANITPGQLAALAKRVSALEKSNAALTTYVNTCLRRQEPLAVYTTNIDYHDGTPPLVFENVAPPAAGTNPDFWVPESTNPACASAK